MKTYSIGLLFLYLLFTNINAQVWVEGHCFLENQIDHSGTMVIFEATSPSAISDTSFTNIEGFYQASLAPGIYNILYNHSGYFEESTPQSCFNNTILSDITLLKKYEGIHISGAISGVFQDTIYIVDGPLATYGQITIEPGAVFYFNENCWLDIFDTFTAIGTVTDSIKFLPNRKTNSWDQIICENTDSIKFEYCFISGSNKSTPAVKCYNSSPEINHCTITDNFGIGLQLWNSNAIIKNTIIKRSGILEDGVYCIDGAPTFINCTISGNQDHGVRVYNSNPTFINTIIANNPSSGILISGTDTSNVYVTFSNFYNNGGGNIIEDPIIGNVLPFFGQLITVNSNEDSCDAYYNIFEDPLFVNPVQNNFHLQLNSPCIDAGDPNSPFDPDTTIADMGAFYFHQGPQPQIGVTHQNLDFGETIVTFDSTIYLNITNNGSLDLLLTDIYTSDNTLTTDWSISDSIIASGNSLNIGVTFSPSNYIQYNEQLTIQNNDHPVQIGLHGIGVPSEGSFPTSLILTGGGADSINWNYFINNTQPSTNDAYTKLSTGRYYGDTRLFYMNPIAWQDLNGDTLDDGIVDTDSITPETFHQSLIDMYDEPDNQFPNVIFLAGHGHVGEFDINGNVNDNISIDTLSNWINEAQLDQASPLVIIFEACFSGGYLPYLSAPNRIIITACRGDQFADYLNGESFSTHFWHEVWYGNNLWDSFNFAYNWSLANLNGQEAQLDADGNGVPNEASDQIIASNIFLGGQYMHGAGLPKIMDYPSSLQIVNSEVNVWAECNGIMDRVWFRIFPADYTGSPPVNQLPYVEMLNVSGTRYEGTYYDNGFVQLGEDYEIQIGAVDDIFNYAVPRIIPLTVTSLGLDTDKNIPLKYYLNQSYPNPFNSNTTIKFGLKKPQKVELTIYNINGEKIKTLINSDYKAGNHKIVWNGKSNSGRIVSSGLYFYKIKTKDFEKCKKMLLIK